MIVQLLTDDAAVIEALAITAPPLAKLILLSVDFIASASLSHAASVAQTASRAHSNSPARAIPIEQAFAYRQEGEDKASESALAAHAGSNGRTVPAERMSEALEECSSAMVNEAPPAALIVDLAAGATAIEGLRLALAANPSAFRMALFGPEDHRAVEQAINEGHAHEVKLKPLEREIAREIWTHISRKVYQEENRKTEAENREQWIKCLETQMTDRAEAAERDFEDTLTALVNALDIRENESAFHSRRVALTTLYFSIVLGVDTDELEPTYYGALLHDIGKIGIRDNILLKPGGLTTEERGEMERHIEIGVRLLSEVRRLSRALDIPRFHHERWDGGGYPHGLAGEAIPLSARIFTVMDVYDALRSERSYKKALEHHEALTIISAAGGAQFDPEIVDCFARIDAAVWKHLAAAAGKVRSFSQALLACEVGPTVINSI